MNTLLWLHQSVLPTHITGRCYSESSKRYYRQLPWLRFNPCITFRVNWNGIFALGWSFGRKCTWKHVSGERKWEYSSFHRVPYQYWKIIFSSEITPIFVLPWVVCFKLSTYVIVQFETIWLQRFGYSFVQFCHICRDLTESPSKKPNYLS